MKILRKILVCVIFIFTILASSSIAQNSITESFKNRINATIAEVQNLNIIGLNNDLDDENSVSEDQELDELEDDPNQIEGETSDDETYVEDDNRYNVQVELNRIDQQGEKIIDGNKLRVTDATENSSEQDVEQDVKDSQLNIKILDLISGDTLEKDEEGNISTSNQGVIIDLSNLKQNKEYRILIEDIQSAEGYLRTINSLILQVSIDDEENIIAKIVNIKNTSGEDIDVSGQNDVNLQGAGPDGTLKIGQEENSADTQIKYIIKNNTEDQGESEEIGDNEEWQDYSENVKIKQNSRVYAKAVKNGKESGISLMLVNNIDKEAPKVISAEEINEGEDRKVSVKVNIQDNASGIVKYGISTNTEEEPDSYIYADNELTEQDILAKRNKNPKNNIEGTIEEIYENGTYYIWVWDTAGNCEMHKIEIEKVNEIPVAEIVKVTGDNHQELLGRQYTSLHKAIEDCPTDGSNTTIKLLAEIYNEKNVIDNNRNITLNLSGYTVNNKSMKSPTIKVNEGTSFTVINTDDAGLIQTQGSISSQNTETILVKKGGSLTLRNR